MSGTVTVGTVKGYLELTDKWTGVLLKADSSLATFSKKAAVIGTGLTAAVSAPLIAAGASAVNFAKTFQSTMTKVETLAEVDRRTVQAWKNDMKEMSNQLGRTPTELAQGLLVVTSAGERSGQALKVLREAAMASSIGLGDTATVARAVTGTMQAYKNSNLTAAEATRIMISTVVEGNLEASELAGTLGRVVGISAQAGVSFQEVGAFLATFTRLGVDAAEATTALRGVLSTVIKPTQEARDALAAMKDPTTGAAYSIDALRNAIKEKGLTQALLDLYKMVGDDVDALGSIIPNVRALAGFLGTAGSQGKEFAGIIDRINKAAADTNYTQEKFARTTEDLGWKWDAMKAKLQNAAVAMGEQLLPAATNIVDKGLTPVITKASDIIVQFDKLPGSAKSAISSIVAVGVVAGPATLALSGLAKAVQAVSGALTWLAGTSIVQSALGVGKLMKVMGPGAGLHLVFLNIKAAILEAGAALTSFLASAAGGALTGAVAGIAFLVAGMRQVTAGVGPGGIKGDIERALRGGQGKFAGKDIELKAPTTYDFGFTLNETVKPVKAATTAAKELSDAQKDLLAQYSGAGLLQKGRDYALVMRQLGGVTKLTADEQEEFRNIFLSVIEKYRLMGPAGKGVADHFQQLANSIPLVRKELFFMAQISPEIVKVDKELLDELRPLEMTTWAFGKEILPVVKDNTKKVGEELRGQKTNVIGMGEAIDGLSRAFSELSEISGGSIAAVVKGVGSFISTMSVVNKGVETFKNGQKAWAEAANSTQKTAAAMSMVAGGVSAGAGMMGAVLSIASAWDAHQAKINAELKKSRDAVKQFISGAGGLEELRHNLSLTGMSWDSWASLLKRTEGNFEQTQTILDNLNKRLQALKEAQDAAASALDIVSNLTSDWTKRLDDAKEGTIDLTAEQAEFNKLGKYVITTFAALVNTSGNFYKSLKEITPVLAELAKGQAKLGLSASKALEDLLSIQKVQSKYSALLDPLSQATELMELLNKAGVTSQETFDALQADAVSAYKAMIKGGTESNVALALMQPTLQMLWRAWKDGKIAIDDETAALLRQAETAGIVGEDQKSVNERLIDSFADLKDAIDKMTLAIAGWGDAAAEGFRKATEGAEKYGKAVPRGSVPGVPEVPGASQGDATTGSDETGGGSTGGGGAVPRGFSYDGLAVSNGDTNLSVYVTDELVERKTVRAVQNHLDVFIR